MPEPTTTSTVTAAACYAGGPALPFLAALSLCFGLEPQLLVAGLFGALGAVVLLDSVPATGDTWQHMVGTGVRRAMVAAVSSGLAAYFAPFLASQMGWESAGRLVLAVTSGACAQPLLRLAVDGLQEAGRRIFSRGAGA